MNNSDCSANENDDEYHRLKLICDWCEKYEEESRYTQMTVDSLTGQRIRQVVIELLLPILRKDESNDVHLSQGEEEILTRFFENRAREMCLTKG